MTAVVLNFRPFQTARDAARKVGMDDTAVIRDICRAQAEGHDGHDIAGALRRKVWEIRNGSRPGPVGPDGAA